MRTRHHLSGFISPLLFLALFFLLSCSTADTGTDALPGGNAVYYWRTEWQMDSIQRSFLQRHGVQRVYCRYFDVVMDTAMHQPMPNATIAFTDSVPQTLELVPTVYITENCLHHVSSLSTDTLAARIVKRVVQMNQTNDLPPANELQIDCDYTSRSRDTYYALLAAIREGAARHGMRLSTTIRLHQLSMPAPPADYGVLMLYNTGDPRRFAERNPVLDERDVRPYADHLEPYPLPLAAAYPVYCWQRHIGGVRIEHTVDAAELLAVKRLVEKRRPALSNTIIAYHLSKENIERYSNDTYEALFHH